MISKYQQNANKKHRGVCAAHMDTVLTEGEGSPNFIEDPAEQMLSNKDVESSLRSSDCHCF